jgi:hypothetical protein
VPLGLVKALADRHGLAWFIPSLDYGLPKPDRSVSDDRLWRKAAVHPLKIFHIFSKHGRGMKPISSTSGKSARRGAVAILMPIYFDAYIRRQDVSPVVVAADNVELSKGQSDADARARAFLESFARRRILITYQELANALQILPPHSIHRVTQALERLMEEDMAADRPFIAAIAISKARGGLPGAGFFDCARRLGRFAGDPDGHDTRTFHAAELNAVFAYWSGSCNN